MTDASNRETSMESMKKKENQMMELSDEDNEEERWEEKNTNTNMVNDSKVNKMKRKCEILMDFLQDLETAEANFCQCSIGKRNLKCSQDC